MLLLSGDIVAGSKGYDIEVSYGETLTGCTGVVTAINMQRHGSEPQLMLRLEDNSTLSEYGGCNHDGCNFSVDRSALHIPHNKVMANIAYSNLGKVQFDIDRLDADGLQGPPDGLRALHYEYCIPDQLDAIRKVTAIDPTLQIQRNSPGRVGCSEDELLCLGHTHQTNYRTVLKRLTTLSIVREIREAFFE